MLVSHAVNNNNFQFSYRFFSAITLSCQFFTCLCVCLFVCVCAIYKRNANSSDISITCKFFGQSVILILFRTPTVTESFFAISRSQNNWLTKEQLNLVQNKFKFFFLLKYLIKKCMVLNLLKIVPFSPQNPHQKSSKH